MANRRTLKKQIRAILGQLMDECIICNLVLPKFDNTTLDTFAARIIENQSDNKNTGTTQGNSFN